MKGVDPVWIATLSDLFVNLSSGWFGVVFILPATSHPTKRVNLWALTGNIVFGIVSLVVAFKLKTLGGV